jgi:hypothetical protein
VTIFYDMQKRRPLRRQPNEHNFRSLAVTAGAFLRVAWVAHKEAILLSSGFAHSLKGIDSEFDLPR